MIEKIIALFLGAKGADVWCKVRDFLKGSRTYLVAGVMMLQGLSGLALDLSKCDTVAALWPLVQGLSMNPDWKMVLAGLLAMFGRSALEAKGPGQ
jgi:hypothetical protein